MSATFELGFLGAGNMAEAMARAAIRAGTPPAAVCAADPSPVRRHCFASLGARAFERNADVVRQSRVIVLAVKPQVWRGALLDCAALVRAEQLIITIMAGVATRAIEDALPGISARVVRAMPNLPMQVGDGMSGICAGRHATRADLTFAQELFDAGGKAVVVPDEELLHAVTGISGSGPAYFYYFTEALIEAGVRAGLSPEHASLLARQTCLGAGRMMIETGEPPSTLRERVTSPGGTTFAALEALRRQAVFEKIVAGALAAERRSRELGT